MGSVVTVWGHLMICPFTRIVPCPDYRLSFLLILLLHPSGSGSNDYNGNDNDNYNYNHAFPDPLESTITYCPFCSCFTNSRLRSIFGDSKRNYFIT